MVSCSPGEEEKACEGLIFGGVGSSLSRVTRIWGVASLSIPHGSVKVAAPFVPALRFPLPASPSGIPGGLSGVLHGGSVLLSLGSCRHLSLLSLGVWPDCCLKKCSHLSPNHPLCSPRSHAHTGKSAQGPFKNLGFANKSLQTSCHPAWPIRPPKWLFLLGPTPNPPPRIRAKAPPFPSLKTLHSVLPWPQICCVSLCGLADFSELLGVCSGK